MTTPEVKENFSICTYARRLLGVKREGAPLYSKCGYTPTGLCSDIHPSNKLFVHVGEGPRTGQVWEKKWDNWSNGNKDPEGLSYISDLSHLFTVLFLIRKDAHTLSECVALSSFSLQSDQITSDQSLSHVRLFATPWIAARQASLSITNSRSSLRLTSVESVMPSSHLILCCPLLLLPPVPPSIRVFSNESTLR